MAKKKSEAAKSVRRSYGCVADTPDKRDRRYAAPHPVLRALPPKVDLSSQMPRVLDQGSLGCCVWHGVADAFRHALAKQKVGLTAPAVAVARAANEGFMPSRLFGYYNTRVIERTVREDAGCQIRDAIKSLVQAGVCSEAEWPYRVGDFTRKPPASCYKSAMDRQGLEYRRVAVVLDQIKGCIAEGFSVIAGITLYESFEGDQVARTGNVSMPRPSERPVGGHCVMIVGYNDATRKARCRNSWSPAWGNAGYFTLPYEYIVDPDLTADLWTLRRVEEGKAA